MSERAILWTGGLDSTWLVIDALLAGDTVAAFSWTGTRNLIVPEAKAEHEAAARERLADQLPSPLRRRLAAVTFTDSQISGLFMPLWKEMCAAQPDWWSPQNYVLASLPALLGPVEAGIVADDHTASQPGILRIMEREGVALPILGQHKRDLVADAKARGFLGLLTDTWTCEWTEIAAACGKCEACRLREQVLAA